MSEKQNLFAFISVLFCNFHGVLRQMLWQFLPVAFMKLACKLKHAEQLQDVHSFELDCKIVLHSSVWDYLDWH